MNKLSSPTSSMKQLTSFLDARQWPLGIARYITSLNNEVMIRYIVIDNSRSMLNKDGRLLIQDENGDMRFASFNLHDSMILFILLILSIITIDSFSPDLKLVRVGMR